jgi:Hemerythrin HHE cation binding domain
MACDPFEMALVHSGFRRELHNAAGLVGGVSAGDSRRAAVVYEHIDFMMTAVHFHHSAEDRVVWPRLFARAPGRAAELTRMEDAHRTIDDACERVRATAVAWSETGDPRRAEELMPVIEGSRVASTSTSTTRNTMSFRLSPNTSAPRSGGSSLRTGRRS